jgi:hypothetical protein
MRAAAECTVVDVAAQFDAPQALTLPGTLLNQ